MPGAAPGMPPAGGGPISSPMSSPQPNAGVEKAARVDVQIAMKQLSKTLSNFPIESEQFKAVMSALGALRKGFGETEDKDRELIPAEIMQLLSTVQGQAPGAAAMAAKPPIPPAGGPPSA